MQAEIINLTSEGIEEDDDLIGLITSNADAGGQYVVFRNGVDKLFAINVAKVEELIAMKDLDITPNSDQHALVTGVAKVRGKVIPIVKYDFWFGVFVDDESIYELVMICNYGNERFGLIIKNVLGIISIDSNKMADNSQNDPKTSYVTEISLSGAQGLCMVFNSDRMLSEVFPKIEEDELKKISNIEVVQPPKGIILSAEDSSVIRRVLVETYNKLGLNYEIFQNGKLLLDNLKTLNPDDVALIITDLEMPVMDGIKLMELIKADPTFENIPIIVNTNMANGSVWSKCFDLGAKQVIGKLDVESLSNAINEYARH